MICSFAERFNKARFISNNDKQGIKIASRALLCLVTQQSCIVSIDYSHTNSTGGGDIKKTIQAMW